MFKLNKSVPEINIFLSDLSTYLLRKSTTLISFENMNNSKLTEC